MKSFFKTLKFVLLAVLLIGLAIGYLFFRVWQKNERPTVTESAWNNEEVILGHDAILDLTIVSPWHREVSDAWPNSYPPFLVPVPGKSTLTKDSLTLTGKRSWNLRVPFVATEIKSLEGLTASFPIKSTKRISPNSVTLPLPTLTIISPAEVPETPHDPETFLTEDKPKKTPNYGPEIHSKRSPWLWALLALLLIPVIFLILRKTGVLKSTPPWEKALSKLDKLDPQTQPIAFYSKLTDILKQYTSERFSVRARSKTSIEFIQVLRNHPQIPKDNLDALATFANLADAVKFADRIPNATEAPKSLELVRSFVNVTTPQPKSDSSDV
ncbi:MAG: hypothetical protein ACJAQT_002184 [Akkermansiaceae bacterium]|jgi:hypothetical protein